MSGVRASGTSLGNEDDDYSHQMVVGDLERLAQRIAKLQSDITTTQADLVDAQAELEAAIAGIDLTAYATKAANLSDLTNVSDARDNLGLGGVAVLNVGTTAGTVAAGDDARIDRAIPIKATSAVVTSYTSGSGTHAFTSGKTFVSIYIVGGGGGGGGLPSGISTAGGGGGGGGASTLVTARIADIGSGISYVVGAGGAAGVAGGYGGNGTASSAGSFSSSGGSGGGPSNWGGPGGLGGSASSSYGHSATCFCVTTPGSNGCNGTEFGFGGLGGAGYVSSSYGGGGTGGYAGIASPLAGQSGLVEFVEW